MTAPRPIPGDVEIAAHLVAEGTYSPQVIQGGILVHEGQAKYGYSEALVLARDWAISHGYRTPYAAAQFERAGITG